MKLHSGSSLCLCTGRNQDRKEKSLGLTWPFPSGFQSPAGINALTGIQMKKRRHQISLPPETPTSIYMITLYKICVL